MIGFCQLYVQFIRREQWPLYADDAIILTESEEDIQKALNAAYQYCSNFNIQI